MLNTPGLILYDKGSCVSYNGGYNGTIQSPNYPNNYCNSLDCRYSITVPVGYRARLHFTDFQTELFYDVVNVIK